MADKNKSSRFRFKSFPIKSFVRDHIKNLEIFQMNLTQYEDAEISSRHRTYYIISKKVNPEVTIARYAWGETYHDWDNLHLFCYKPLENLNFNQKKLGTKLCKTFTFARKIYARPLHIVIGYDRVNTKIYNYNEILSNYEINPKLITAIDQHLQLVYKKHGKIIVDKNINKNIIKV